MLTLLLGVLEKAMRKIDILSNKIMPARIYVFFDKASI
jgi:hypothetical protein